MVSHMAKAIAAVEELKVFLVCDSAEKLKKRLDKLFMVLILQSFHSDYDHVHEQILSRDQIPSMNSLVARLLYVPTLVKGENAATAVETLAMVASRGWGRGGCGSRGGERGGRGG